MKKKTKKKKIRVKIKENYDVPRLRANNVIRNADFLPVINAHVHPTVKAIVTVNITRRR